MKVFLSPIRRGYYRGSPSTSFQVEVNYSVCLPGTESADPDTEEGVMILTVADDLSDLYSVAWAQLQAICTANGWGNPQKQDVFIYDSTTLDKVLP
jgi:hypothetical protein